MFSMLQVNFSYGSTQWNKPWSIVITYGIVCLPKLRNADIKPWRTFHLRERKMWVWQALHIGIFLRCQSNQVDLLCAVTLPKHWYSYRQKSLDNPKWEQFWLSQCRHAVTFCTLLLFLMTEIRKNIGMESIFSTIMLVGVSSLYRIMTYSLVYETYSHTSVLCMCTLEKQTDTQQNSENVSHLHSENRYACVHVWPKQ